jgi:hypothetical protein
LHKAAQKQKDHEMTFSNIREFAIQDQQEEKTAWDYDIELLVKGERG